MLNYKPDLLIFLIGIIIVYMFTSYVGSNLVGGNVTSVQLNPDPRVTLNIYNKIIYKPNFELTNFVLNS